MTNWPIPSGCLTRCRTFDSSSVGEIYASVRITGGWLAVGNRLKKAAGFHVIEADSTQVVLGLTGGTGAGKTSALRAIGALGGTVIDCDARLSPDAGAG